jgi:C4-dicarboxylate-specific signal transduction histidine kinase
MDLKTRVVVLVKKNLGVYIMDSQSDYLTQAMGALALTDTKPLTRYERYGHIMRRNVATYREKHKDDPAYQEKKRAWDRDNKRSRYHSDPEYREKMKAYNRERYYRRQIEKMIDSDVVVID